MTAPGETAQAEPLTPGPQEIRAQLQRLRSTDPVASSPQLVSFLDFVVEEALAGRGRDLKGYTIAVEALGRSPDFDPQHDPIVRVEARRLRLAIKTYYEGVGRADPITIEIPVGGYLPVFRTRTQRCDDDPRRVAAEGPGEPLTALEALPQAQPQAEPQMELERQVTLQAEPPSQVAGDAVSRLRDVAPVADVPAPPGAWAAPSVRPWTLALVGSVAAVLAAVAAATLIGWSGTDVSNRIALGHGSEARQVRLPVVRIPAFEASGAPPPVDVARRVAERLAVALSRFDELRILGPSAPSSQAGDASEYLLRGRLLRRPDGTYGLGAALLAPGSRDILLAREFASFQPDEVGPTGESRATSELRFVRDLAVDLAQPHGVIAADQTARLTKDPSETGGCLLAAHAYWRAPTRDGHAKARACLTGAVATAKPRALVQAQLSFLALDEYRLDYNPAPGAPLERALAHARAAVDAAPGSARAHQALMDGLYLRGDVDQALRAGERALALNPYDPDILADYGARLVQSGRDIRGGRERLVAAAVATPVRAPWHDFYLVVSAMLVGDREAAIAHAHAIVSDADALGLIARLIGAKERGDADEVEDLGRKLVALDARYGAEPRALLARRGISPPILDWLTAMIEGATAGRSP